MVAIRPCRMCGRDAELSAAQVKNRHYVCRDCQARLNTDPSMPGKAAYRARAQAFVAEVNARTFCAHCGAQPIEWHNPDHVALGRQKYRIGEMAAAGYSTRKIEAEMVACTPLCRRCHMAEDGRLEAFADNRPRFTPQPPKPCADCGELYKPLRRGQCNRCYLRRRRANGEPVQTLGLEFGVHHATISRVARGVWRQEVRP